MSASSLQFQNVSFTYASMTRPLLVEVKAHFPTGWTGVVGPNGAGKSTLLMLAVGELKPEEGTVTHSGQAIYCAQRTDLPPEALPDFMYAGDREAMVLRDQLGLHEGDEMVAEIEDGRLVLSTRAARLKRAQALIEKYCPAQPGVSVVDEFIAERRKAASTE